MLGLGEYRELKKEPLRIQWGWEQDLCCPLLVEGLGTILNTLVLPARLG